MCLGEARRDPSSTGAAGRLQRSTAWRTSSASSPRPLHRSQLRTMPRTTGSSEGSAPKCSQCSDEHPPNFKEAVACFQTAATPHAAARPHGIAADTPRSMLRRFPLESAVIIDAPRRAPYFWLCLLQRFAQSCTLSRITLTLPLWQTGVTGRPSGKSWTMSLRVRAGWTTRRAASASRYGWAEMRESGDCPGGRWRRGSGGAQDTPCGSHAVPFGVSPCLAMSYIAVAAAGHAAGCTCTFFTHRRLLRYRRRRH